MQTGLRWKYACETYANYHKEETMNRTIPTLCAVLGIIALLTTVPATAQTVNVTMVCNTSTCLDTLKPNHVVVLCGESQKGTTTALTWDTGSVKCTNIGGDYWQATFPATVGDTLRYKFVTFFDLQHRTFHWDGWEGPINAGMSSNNNRAMIVGSSDTTLPLQYFNGWESTLAQYWRPFVNKTDSIAIYFRVNMGGATFDTATQIPLVYGGAPMGADPSWVQIGQRSREINSVNHGSFWSGVVYVAKATVTSNVTQKYKFVINSPLTWESTSDRSFTFTTNLRTVTGDTTLLWHYFNDQPPRGAAVTGNVNFRLRLDALEKAGLFNRGLGDRVGVTGPKGWAPASPDFDNDPTILKMTFVPLLQEWVLVESFTLPPYTPFVYKYYIAFDSSKVDTASPNFIPGLRLTDGWEEPGVTGGGNRSYTFDGTPSQMTPGDFGALQQFFNSLHPNSVIMNPITLTFKINMAPAADIVTNPTNALFRPGIDTAYIQFDGCLIPITQGLSMYGTDNRLMLKDTAGLGVYTASIDLKAPTFFQVCYRLVYTSPGGEVSNGGGVQMGRRYYQYIAPTSVNVSTVTWPSSFTLAQVDWMANNLTVESPPYLGVISDVATSETPVPGTFALEQNYPNPFNPTTLVTYSIPQGSHVTIEVFNILGQKVTTLFDGMQVTGTHSIAWNAQNERGSVLGSGVYFLRMQAGSFSQVRKMVLMK